MQYFHFIKYVIFLNGKKTECEWKADGNQQRKTGEKTEWLKRKKEAFRSQPWVMVGFVSQPATGAGLHPYESSGWRCI